MRFFKITLPIILAFVMSVVAITAYFVPHHWSGKFMQENTNWSKVISGVTIFIGVYSLLRVHYGKIKRQGKGWGYSVVLYVFFAAIVFFGILNDYGSPKAAKTKANAGAKQAASPTTAPDKSAAGPTTQPALAATTRPAVTAAGPTTAPAVVSAETKKDQDKAAPLSGFQGPFKPQTTADEGVKWLYTSVGQPGTATTYSLLGFFICSAAYRTFRAKSFDAALLLITALIVMFCQVPISERLWTQFPTISDWLLAWPNMAVKRAVSFGICVGSVSTSLRVMFGLERSYMGGD